MSEIAEKAAREAAEAVHKLYCKNYSVENGHFCEAATSCDALTIKPFVERAIAESQAPQPEMCCESCGRPPTDHLCSRDVNFEYYTAPKLEGMQP